MVLKAYMVIQKGGSINSDETQPPPAPLGHLDLILYNDTVPKTVENFCSLIKSGKYNNCMFHRIIPNFMAQGGDYENQDGTGGQSLLFSSSSSSGKQQQQQYFDDENFLHLHDKRGILSMANCGPNTNGSQFFITFRPTPHLNNKHVVFGHVDLSSPSSQQVLQAMESIPTRKSDNRPTIPLIIVECGVLQESEENDVNNNNNNNEKRQQQQQQVQSVLDDVKKPVADEDMDDDNEIDLDNDGDGEEENNDDDQEVEQQQQDDDPNTNTKKSKKSKMQDRLRKLKMKMNQARQLNQKEVTREAQRFMDPTKFKKEMKYHDQQLEKEQFEKRNAKTKSIGGVDTKYLVQQAADSMKKASKKEENRIANQFATNDYYNSEGQFRHYERNLKSLPSSDTATVAVASSAEIYNPTDLQDVKTNQERDAIGARRIANEMKKRMEKASKKRSKQEEEEFEQTDVSYINKRNKRFNEKISRNYDKHTAEIRQNLERGTAL